MLSRPGTVAAGNALFYRIFRRESGMEKKKRKKYKKIWKKLLTLEKFFARMILALLMKTKSGYGLQILDFVKVRKIFSRKDFLAEGLLKCRRRERRMDMERYRSGHNEAVLKTVCPQGRVGSNPTLSAGETSPNEPYDSII